VRSGSGRPLLVLHGGPAVNDYSDWFAAELAGWDVLRYTQRGVAPSVTEGPFTIEQHVADALAVLFRLKPRRSRTRCARLTIAPGLASSLARGAGLPGRGAEPGRRPAGLTCGCWRLNMRGLLSPASRHLAVLKSAEDAVQ
jgi:hypothetical protein